MARSSIPNQNSQIVLRLIRRRMRRIARMARFRRTTLSNVPILFANSFPKSGTHLLTQVLIGFTHIGPAVNSGLPSISTFIGDSGQKREASDILKDFKRLLPGDIAYGHVHALPDVVDYVCQDGFAPYFILRDPRDVVVSHVHYITDMAPHHIHHHYYKHVLKNFDQRLHASIGGISNDLDSSNDKPLRDRSLHGAAVPLPDIYQRFEPYAGWLDRPEVLVLRYESFITHGEETIGNVLDHAILRGFKPTCDRETAIKVLADSISPQSSPTFRSGKIGGWRTSFKDEHKQQFKEVTGDLVIRLGYEQDHNW